MGKIETIADLKMAIAQLEIKQYDDGLRVQQHLRKIQEDLKPSHLIKEAFIDIIASPDLKSGVIDVSMGAAAGLFVKTIFEGKKPSLLQKLLVNTAATFVSTEVTKNGEQLRSWGSKLLKKW